MGTLTLREEYTILVVFVLRKSYVACVLLCRGKCRSSDLLIHFLAAQKDLMNYVQAPCIFKKVPVLFQLSDLS